MLYFLVAFGALLHVLLWGAGLARLALPARWRTFWPIFAMPAGFALQSAVVWFGALADFRGTHSYAWIAEVVPVALLVWAGSRGGWKRMVGELRQCLALFAVMAVCVSALVFPLSRASNGLTTSSLGSCDAADYAAGARVFMEFARSDRGGFLGLTEVVQVMSADNFFDVWLRLNHFTPSALLALNGVVLDCAPYELTSIFTAVLLAASLPMMFWMARAVFRYRRWPSLWLAALYGFNPITWYAVYHVAMGQLLAAQAIALLTWVGVALWRNRLTWRRGVSVAGALAIGYWLVLGSYNFIVLVCLVPAVAYAAGVAMWRGEWRRLLDWTGAMLLPLVACGFLFFGRVSGLVERFMLFRQHDFGWRIPAFSPEGWLGMVKDSVLAPYSLGPRVALTVLVLAMVLGAVAWGVRRRCPAVFLGLCLVVPPLVGYGYLTARGALLGTNASYDAYKLLAVFYPGLLAGLCGWLGWLRGAHVALRMAAIVALVGVTALNLQAVSRFAERMESPPLIVDRELWQLREIEDWDDVASLNMHITDFWSRLWANAFLLRKPQYFPTHTYEGRLNTELKGEWDLMDEIVKVRVPWSKEMRTVNSTYTLQRVDAKEAMRARLGDGWHEMERHPRVGKRWRWTNGNATIRLHNASGNTLAATFRLDASSVREREVEIRFNGTSVAEDNVGMDMERVIGRGIKIPTGDSVIELYSSAPPVTAGANDLRPLGLMVHAFEVELSHDGSLPTEAAGEGVPAPLTPSRK